MYTILWSSSGRKEIINLCESTGLVVATSCYDFIIDNDIFSDQDVLQKTLIFLEISKNLSCEAVVLPFLEKVIFVK